MKRMFSLEFSNLNLPSLDFIIPNEQNILPNLDRRPLSFHSSQKGQILNPSSEIFSLHSLRRKSFEEIAGINLSFDPPFMHSDLFSQPKRSFGSYSQKNSIQNFSSFGSFYQSSQRKRKLSVGSEKSAGMKTREAEQTQKKPLKKKVGRQKCLYKGRLEITINQSLTEEMKGQIILESSLKSRKKVLLIKNEGQIFCKVQIQGSLLKSLRIKKLVQDNEGKIWSSSDDEWIPGCEIFLRLFD